MPDAGLLTRLRQDLGEQAVETAPDGIPRVLPDSTEAVADLAGLAYREGLRVRIEGRGTWIPPDSPAQFAISTRRLDRLSELAPADLVATVEAGLSLAALNHQLENQRAWLAIDPPGSPDRSLGSVLATGTAGPLRHAFGPIRDHLLGVTVVTGEGKVVRAGGKVVKNVAGYDLTRLEVGSFGGFGVITQAHLRLRAVPAERRTHLAVGERDRLTRAGRELMEDQLSAGSLELCAPEACGLGEWGLVLDLLATPEAVDAESLRVASPGDLSWTRLTDDAAATLHRTLALAPLRQPVTIRLGVFPDGLDDTLDLITERLGAGIVTAGAGRGMLRWSGWSDPTRLLELRRILAAREIPMTLERAPWELRQAVGHFGDYREGVGGLIHRLRDVFDPRPIFPVPLEADSVT